jgi:membrane associated rhomboid family serine protease
MYPISDSVSTRRTPVVTWTLIAINVVIFLYELSLGDNLDQFAMTWGAVPAYITDPANHPMAFLTLITSMFLHGGWLHLIGNMVYLWIFGDNIEDTLGHRGYLLFYLAAGVAAGLAQVFAAPSSTIPGIGASGAIAGVLGAYLMLYPGAPVKVAVPGIFALHIAWVPALVVLAGWFVLQLLNGFMSLGAETAAEGGVAWFAHIGGFVFGLVAGLLVRQGSSSATLGSGRGVN